AKEADAERASCESVERAGLAAMAVEESLAALAGSAAGALEQELERATRERSQLPVDIDKRELEALCTELATGAARLDAVASELAEARAETERGEAAVEVGRIGVAAAETAR